MNKTEAPVQESVYFDLYSINSYTLGKIKITANNLLMGLMGNYLE